MNEDRWEYISLPYCSGLTSRNSLFSALNLHSHINRQLCRWWILSHPVNSIFGRTYVGLEPAAFIHTLRGCGISRREGDACVSFGLSFGLCASSSTSWCCVFVIAHRTVLLLSCVGCVTIVLAGSTSGQIILSFADSNPTKNISLPPSFGLREWMLKLCSGVVSNPYDQKAPLTFIPPPPPIARRMLNALVVFYCPAWSSRLCSMRALVCIFHMARFPVGWKIISRKIIYVFSWCLT